MVCEFGLHLSFTICANAAFCCKMGFLSFVNASVRSTDTAGWLTIFSIIFALASTKAKLPMANAAFWCTTRFQYFVHANISPVHAPEWLTIWAFIVKVSSPHAEFPEASALFPRNPKRRSFNQLSGDPLY